MLCWANENWARNWDGGFKDVLIKQEYSFEDDVAHMRYLCENVFVDKRYISVYGKPFFIVYRPSLFLDIQETIRIWRKTASEYGMELYLGFMNGWEKDQEIYLSSGFDVSVEFQPHFSSSHIYARRNMWNWFSYKLKTKLFHGANIDPLMESIVWDYSDFINSQCNRLAINHKEYPCVTPQWDNASRRTGSIFWCLDKSTPQLYGQWLRHVLKTFKPFSEDENFVFINAWNEWAEGNHLEPDQKWGRGYLEETMRAIDEQ